MVSVFHRQGWLAVVVVVVVLAQCSSWGLVQAAPDIQFSFGRVQGQDETAEDTQRPYSAYYGIPFATPPVGSLRFKPPQPFVNNNPATVISSSSFRPTCVQPSGWAPGPEMSEDCLHLNVYVPPTAGASPIDRKKVMVFIHGGGYVLGSAREYKSSRIVTDYDVIVVILQYRLGVLGFLSTADDVQPGNNAYLDQIMGLKWVKANIGQFGGDPDDITIFGESAGAGSVSALSISPLTKGLFTKSIMQSGTTLTPWSIIKKPRELTYQLAKKAGCLPFIYVPGFLASYHERMVECLRRKPTDAIIFPFSFGEGAADAIPNFGPVIDGIVLPKDPKYLIKDHDYLRRVGALDRSYIIGVANNEGLTFVRPGAALKAFTKPKNVRDLIRSTTESVLPVIPSREVLDVVSFVYTYPRSPISGEIPLDKTLNLITDAVFAVPSILFARGLLEASPSVKIYFYLFDHYPELNIPDFPVGGSTHALDLIYLFDRTPDFDDVSFYAKVNTPADAPLYGIFRGALTSFAKTGFPSVSRGLNWPRFDRSTEFYMSVSTSPKVKQHLYSSRVALWTDFIPKLVEDNLSGYSRRPEFTL